MLDAPKKAGRVDMEAAIMDAAHDLHLLQVVMNEANDSPRNDQGERSCIMVDEAVFLAWFRVCHHTMASVREVEKLFYEAGR